MIRRNALHVCVGAGGAVRLLPQTLMVCRLVRFAACALQRRDGSVGVPLNCPFYIFKSNHKSINGERKGFNRKRKAFDLKRRHFNASRKGFNGYHRTIDDDNLGFNTNHNTIDDNHKWINDYHTDFNSNHSDFDDNHGRLIALQNSFDGITKNL